VIELKVSGKPSTKGRPRFDPRTRRAYSPPSNIVSENDIRAVWREAGEPRIEGKVPIEIQIIVDVVRPQGHFRKNGNLSLEGVRNPIPCNKKPDLDNALKTVMDALNSRAYQDDVQIARVRAERRWALWPSTTIFITEIDGDHQTRSSDGEIPPDHI
jgi:Holliday junction resolvase RusA-like endonuclease